MVGRTAIRFGGKKQNRLFYVKKPADMGLSDDAPCMKEARSKSTIPEAQCGKTVLKMGRTCGSILNSIIRCMDYRNIRDWAGKRRP